MGSSTNSSIPALNAQDSSSNPPFSVTNIVIICVLVTAAIAFTAICVVRMAMSRRKRELNALWNKPVGIEDSSASSGIGTSQPAKISDMVPSEKERKVNADDWFRH